MYVKYHREEDAGKALQVMHGRFYDRRQLTAEFSPVTDFADAVCSQFVDNSCRFGDLCNFMHIKPVPRELKDDLMRTQPHAGENRDRCVDGSGVVCVWGGGAF